MNLSMNPLTMIPAGARQYIYIVYSLVLLCWGALSILYTDPDPDWVNKGGDVLQYFGIALGFTAASNVKTGQNTPRPKSTGGGGRHIKTGNEEEL